jgi:hypothetical protein
MGVNTQPVPGTHASEVHGLLSLHVTGPPAAQAPPLHVSPVVQAFPSSQGAALLLWKHPVTGLHRSSVQTFPSLHVTAVVSVNTQPTAGTQVFAVQTLLSSQIGGGPPLQVPPPHVSPVVQKFPSSQVAVLAA